MVLRFLQSEVYNTQKKALNFAYRELESEALNTNEEQEDITMQNNETISNTQERGTIPMLTYEQKRSLLESKLNEMLRPNGEETECCYYCWVCDLDEADVYYCYKDTYYKASYIINEDESAVEINVNEAKQVTRSWKEFALEEQEEVQETFVEEDVKEKEEFIAEKKAEDYSEVEDSKEEALEDEEKECGTQCSEDCDDKEEGSEEVEQKENAAKDGDGEIFTEEKSKEEQEVEDKEECSEEKEGNAATEENSEEVEDKEEQFIDNENVYKEYTFNLMQFKDDGSEDETLEITMTTTEENYSQIVSACQETATTLEALRANYSELKTNYDELKVKYDEVVLAQTIEGFCAYGKEFFMNEETLDTENKNSLIEQFEEKCKNNEFSSEEEIQSYAEAQIAKAVYQQVKNNKEKNNETVNFSAKIKTSTEQTEVVIEEDSMAKMKTILKI